MNIACIRNSHPRVLKSNIDSYITAVENTPNPYSRQAYIATLIETAAAINAMSILVHCLRSYEDNSGAESVITTFDQYAPLLSSHATTRFLTAYRHIYPTYRASIDIRLNPMSKIATHSCNYSNALMTWACIIEDDRIPELHAYIDKQDAIINQRETPNPIDFFTTETHNRVRIILAYRTNAELKVTMFRRILANQMDYELERFVETIPLPLATSYFMNTEQLTLVRVLAGDTFASPIFMEHIAATFVIMDRRDMFEVATADFEYELTEYQEHMFMTGIQSCFGSLYDLGSIHYTLAILHSDGYLKVRDVDADSDAARFFNITSKLPLEIVQRLTNPQTSYKRMTQWLNDELLDHFRFYFD